jgi:hypothetical protein
MLRGTGVSLTLPWLSTMTPCFADEQEYATPKRFVAMTLGLGPHAANLNPDESGRGYQPSRYLKSSDHLREKCTVDSGSSHPGVGGGHRAEASILTANPVGEFRPSEKYDLDCPVPRQIPGQPDSFPVTGAQ